MLSFQPLSRTSVIASTVLALAASGIGLLTPRFADAAPPPAAAPLMAAPIPTDLLGSAPEYAAGSCWEIKKDRAGATDGAYWLVTPRMVEPQRFYCDQTTDGGGWLLIGKGRNGWLNDDSGKGDAAALLDPGYSTGADTHQYSAQLINQLLNGARPIDLTEGIRIRRAMTADGSMWQEVRALIDTRQTGWSWALGARFGVGSWSFNPTSTTSTSTTSGSGGRSDFWGTGTNYTRVRTVATQAAGWTQGYAYGTNITGTSAPDSYLWSPAGATGTATPVAQVYIRPRVESDDPGFTAIPPAGTPEVERRALPSSDADRVVWGVTGTAGDTSREGSVEVQDFVESAGRMYVAGNFRYVQRDAAGTGRVEQSFLAAFDVDTQEWVSSFRPTFNEQVRALEVLPNGSIVAAGDFTQANGASATAIVALDPVTGATDPSFRLTVEDRTTGGFLRIWDLERATDQLYLGGTFTHLRGGGRPSFTYMKNLARVRASDGRTDPGWNPEMSAAVTKIDGSDDDTRMYAAGHFNVSKGVATRKAAAVLTSFVTRPDGTIQHLADPLWAPVWSANKDYQQAILEVDGKVWSGGSEHSIFGFDRTTFERLNTTILHAKGDIQTFSAQDGVLFAGSHANHQFAYTDATTWSGAGPGGTPWTSAHTQHWVGAYDIASGQALADFAPGIEMRSGVWASTFDSNGRLWIGGDMDVARTVQGPGRWCGGFLRYSARDVTAPATPGNFRVTAAPGEATLAWNAVSDPSGVRYQVLRGDRPIAVTTGTSITVPYTAPAGVAENYWVRAADGEGNISASTAALAVARPGNAVPTADFTVTPEQLTVHVDAAPSSDDGSIVGYAWSFGDGSTATGATASHTYAAAGTYEITLTVTDNDGATATDSASVTVDASVAVQPIAKSSAWSWRYQAGAPGIGWNGPGFDDSTWNQAGMAPLGFAPATASDHLVTDIDTFATTAERPQTAYFRQAFEVADPTTLSDIVVTAIADDGAVFYVNGVEIGRQNMRDGTVTPTTYAPAARRYATANAGLAVLEVPPGLLVAGQNVVAAETHVNYRATPDLTFFLSMDASSAP